MIKLSPPALPVIISAPSGTGKTSVELDLCAKVENIQRSISFTTRSPRQGENHGEDYYFVTPAEFDNKLKTNDFIEHAKVHNNSYGTCRQKVMEAQANNDFILLVIDTQGAFQIKQSMKEAISIFMLPPSFDILHQRLSDRKSEGSDSLATRLRNGQKEIEQAFKFDYVVVNEKVSQCADDIIFILQNRNSASDKFSVKQRSNIIQKILDGYPK